MKGNRLYKYEKLCSRTAINNIFVRGKSVICYPLRAAFSIAADTGTPVQFLVSIPKKKIRKAVNRVLLRRRVREAYRLNRSELVSHIKAKGCSLKVAFLYLSDEIADYAVIDAKMQALMKKINEAVDKSASAENASNSES